MISECPFHQSYCIVVYRLPPVGRTASPPIGRAAPPPAGRAAPALLGRLTLGAVVLLCAGV